MNSINNVKEGDFVEIKTKQSNFSGTIIRSSDTNIISLKLSSGYNIGISKKDVNNLKKIKSKNIKFESPKLKTKKVKKLPNVSLITTGGTITSRVDYRTGAVYALSKPEELLANIPELSNLVNLKIISPFSIMSEDMNQDHWEKLAKLVVIELNNKDVSGVIITHGTDTLHWSASALSMLIKSPISKPIALVGGQRSSDRGSFDGAQNLICAVYYCLSDIAAVSIVMHESPADETCIAIRGTKVRKMHTSRRDAFRPVNELPLARIWPDGKIKILNKNYEKRSNTKASFYKEGLNRKVALIQFAPGTKGELIDYYVTKGYKGIIIQGEGLGHVAVNGKNSWIFSIKKAAKKGVFIGMTSQCLYGRVDPYVYTNLRLINEAGAVFLEDMLPETAYVKLGWVLNQTKKINEIKELMLKNIAGEINKRIPSKAFLY